MKRVAVVLGTLLLASPSLAFHNTMPKDKEVKLVLNEHGDPAAVDPASGIWYMSGKQMDGECAIVTLVTQTDNRRALLVIKNEHKGVDNPTIFYAVSDGENVTEWAGNPDVCNQAPA